MVEGPEWGAKAEVTSDSFRSFDTLRQAQGPSSGHRRLNELRGEAGEVLEPIERLGAAWWSS